jgi:hypothetical protein
MLDGNVGGQRLVPPTVPQERDPIPILEGAGWMPGPGWTNVENTTVLASTTVKGKGKFHSRTGHEGPEGE